MVRLARVVTLLIVAAASAHAQAPPSTPAPQPHQRLWLTTRSDAPTSQAALHVRFAQEHVLPAEITFDCDIIVPEPFEEAHLTLTILDPAGLAIHSGEVKLPLAKGSTPAAFKWAPTGLPNGVYAANFDLERRSGGRLAAHDLKVRLLSQEALTAKLENLKAKAVELRGALNQMNTAATRPAYAMLHTAVIEDYIPFAQLAFDSNDWCKADDFASYLESLANSVRAEMSIVVPETEASWPADGHPLEPVFAKEGAFRTANGPTFLLGAAYQENIEALLPLLNRYGLGVAVYRLAPGDTLSSASAVSGFGPAFSSFMDSAAKNRVHVVLALAPERIPDWLLKQSPELAQAKGSSFPYNIVAPQSRTLLARHLAAALGAAKYHGNLVSVSLAEDPAFQLPDATLREGLIALVRARYKDHDFLNRAWQTRYVDFDEINVDWESRHRAYRYDLEMYHQELCTQFFAWLAETSRATAPGVPVQVQFADVAFAPREAISGVDRESAAAAMDISGCSATKALDLAPLVPGASNQTAYYTLLRSFDPAAPVMNTKDGISAPATLVGDDAFRRVRTMMWESAMSGLGASAIHMGAPGDTARGARLGVLARPELIDGYATANLDLNRLAPIIVQSQNSPADVAILWSQSSRIFDHGVPYLESVARAYEGCTNFGLNVRFISERECEREGLHGVKVLVIPAVLALSNDAFRAIDAYIAAGGVTIRHGQPIPYDEHGLSRKDTISVSTRTILIRGNDTPRAYLDALDAAYDLGGIDIPSRAVNEFGYPIDGVKSRFIVHERVPYLYLVSQQSTPAVVKLVGAYTAGRDLVSGNRMDFPDVLEPFTPMLIQLDAPAEPEKVAPNDASGTPTAEVKPIVTEEQVKAEKKKTARPSMRQGR